MKQGGWYAAYLESHRRSVLADLQWLHEWAIG